MKLSVCGYDVVKNGEWYIIYGIDLTPLKNGVGFKPFFVKRGDNFSIGLWIPASMGFTPTKDIVNKVVRVDFNANGRPVNIEVIK